MKDVIHGTCGHRLRYPYAVEALSLAGRTVKGKRCVSAVLYCPACAERERAAGHILATEAECEAWLKGEG